MSIYKVDLKQCASWQRNESIIRIGLLRHLPLDAPRVVQAMNPSLGLVAVSVSSSVQLVSCLESDTDSPGFIVPAYPDDPDDLVCSLLPHLRAQTDDVMLFSGMGSTRSTSWARTSWSQELDPLTYIDILPPPMRRHWKYRH